MADIWLALLKETFVRLFKRSRPRRTRCPGFVFSCTGELLEARVLLADHTWSGGALLNDNWSTAKNWDENTVPAAGDRLIFPDGVGAFDHNTFNDLPSNTSFEGIQFTGDGYTLSGHAIKLDDPFSFGIRSTVVNSLNPNVINFDITFDRLIIESDAGNVLHLKGSLKGGSTAPLNSALQTNGGGIVFFEGTTPNTYVGDTRVNDGVLSLAKTSGVTALPGNLLIEGADVRVLTNEQIVNSADVIFDDPGSPAKFQIVGSSVTETIHTLTLSSSNSSVTGSGTLVLGTDVNIIPTQFNSTILVDVARLNLGGTTRTFNVAGANQVVVLQTAISNGGIAKTGIGGLSMTGTTPNTYSGLTTVNAGTLTLFKSPGVVSVPRNLVIGTNPRPTPPDNTPPDAKVVDGNSEQIADAATVTVNSTGFLQINNVLGTTEHIAQLILQGGTTDMFGKFTPAAVTTVPSSKSAVLLGKIDIGNDSAVEHVYNIADGSAGSDVVVGGITGTGILRKTGAGAMVVLNDNFSSAVIDARVDDGTLIFSGNTSSATVTVDGGTLAGGGIVGTTNVINGGLSGALRIFGDVSLKSAATLFINISTQVFFDSLFTSGNIALGDTPTSGFPTLNVNTTASFPVGTQFKIIPVASNKTLTGLFKDTLGNVLNEGGSLTINGEKYIITYHGGDGNDVVLIRDAAPAFQNRTLTPTINEGSVATLTGTITEPDAGDTFILVVNWGDGPSQTYTIPPNASRNVSVTHLYKDDPAGSNDVYNVQVEWHDNHGGSNHTEMPITVNNVAPTLSNFAVTPHSAGSVTASGLISDPGVKDVIKVRIQWDAGGPWEIFVIGPGATDFHVTHHYTRPGRHRVTVSVADGDGGFDFDRQWIFEPNT